MSIGYVVVSPWFLYSYKLEVSHTLFRPSVRCPLFLGAPSCPHRKIPFFMAPKTMIFWGGSKIVFFKKDPSVHLYFTLACCPIDGRRPSTGQPRLTSSPNSSSFVPYVTFFNKLEIIWTINIYKFRLLQYNRLVCDSSLKITVEVRTHEFDILKEEEKTSKMWAIKWGGRGSWSARQSAQCLFFVWPCQPFARPLFLGIFHDIIVLNMGLRFASSW